MDAFAEREAMVLPPLTPAATTPDPTADAPELTAVPNPTREARADPPTATATKGMARREVATTTGPARARMGQETEKGVYAAVAG